MLLDHGMKPDRFCLDGQTALHQAAQGGYVKAATVLLRYRAIVDTVTLEGLTALHLAARGGHRPLVHLLLKSSANPGCQSQLEGTLSHAGQTPLDEAIDISSSFLELPTLLCKTNNPKAVDAESSVEPIDCGHAKLDKGDPAIPLHHLLGNLSGSTTANERAARQLQSRNSLFV